LAVVIVCSLLFNVVEGIIEQKKIQAQVFLGNANKIPGLITAMFLS